MLEKIEAENSFANIKRIIAEQDTLINILRRKLHETQIIAEQMLDEALKAKKAPERAVLEAAKSMIKQELRRPIRKDDELMAARCRGISWALNIIEQQEEQSDGI